MPKEVQLNFQGKDAFAPKEQIREDKKNENLMFMEEEEQQNVYKEQPDNTKENAFQLNSNLFENVKVDTLYKLIGELQGNYKMGTNKYFHALKELKDRLENNKR
jgi:hypothetical protein